MRELTVILDQKLPSAVPSLFATSASWWGRIRERICVKRGVLRQVLPHTLSCFSPILYTPTSFTSDPSLNHSLPPSRHSLFTVLLTIITHSCTSLQVNISVAALLVVSLSLNFNFVVVILKPTTIIIIKIFKFIFNGIFGQNPVFRGEEGGGNFIVSDKINAAWRSNNVIVGASPTITVL